MACLGRFLFSDKERWPHYPGCLVKVRERWLVPQTTWRPRRERTPSLWRTLHHNREWNIFPTSCRADSPSYTVARAPYKASSRWTSTSRMLELAGSHWQESSFLSTPGNQGDLRIYFNNNICCLQAECWQGHTGSEDHFGFHRYKVSCDNEYFIYFV